MQRRRQRERLERARTEDIGLVFGAVGAHACRAWSVRGTGGARYTVEMDWAGQLECDCMDGRINRGRLLCKHSCYVLIYVFDIGGEEIESVARCGAVPEGARQSAERASVDVRNSECAICTEAFDETALACVKCRNAFHAKCINEWLAVKASCPMCRRALGDRTLGGVSNE